MKQLLIFLLLSVALRLNAQDINMPALFAKAEKQTKVMLRSIEKAKKEDNPALVSPRSLEENGDLVLVASKDWTSGFFPGVLWYLYEYTGKDYWKEQARAFTGNIEKEQWNGTTHDMGFKVYCSVGNGYRLTKDPHYRDVIIQSAKTLATRFNPVAGVIRSWDNKTKWAFPVIIDNMLNLELLFAATDLTGDSTFYRIAVSHANNTMKNHFRADNSSWHVVEYDTLTPGRIVKKTTHQGYADSSSWARGQSWGLYGFTMCFRETGDSAYLRHAEKIAAYILSHPSTPADGIPYWDFKAPNIPKEPRDASAAAVIASGLYELSLYSKNADEYRAAANKIIESLSSKKYRARIGKAKGFLLLHSTGNWPSHGEIDAPLSYADYYYLEALLRAKKLKENKPFFVSAHNTPPMK